HQLERHALDVADAQRDGAHVHVGQVAVEEIRDDLRFAGAEHFLGNLAAGGEGGAGQRLLATAARQLELEVVAGKGEHDEAGRGAGDLDCRVQHQRQYVVEHAPAAERAQPVEEGRDLPQVADRGGGRLVLARRGV